MDSLSNTPKQASAAEKSTGCCGGKSDAQGDQEGAEASDLTDEEPQEA